MRYTRVQRYLGKSGRESDEARVESALKVLDEAGVALLPGTAFGDYGEGYLRLSYANTMGKIEQALHRMGEVLEKMAG